MFLSPLCMHRPRTTAYGVGLRGVQLVWWGGGWGCAAANLVCPLGEAHEGLSLQGS